MLLSLFFLPLLTDWRIVALSGLLHKEIHVVWIDEVRAVQPSRSYQAEQVTLTQRHISRYLAQPAILRDPQVRKLLREVCREVEEGSRSGPSLVFLKGVLP
jgi:hypothetical protein